MNKFLITLSIIYITSLPVLCSDFETLAPANPLAPQVIPDNTIAIPIKKVTLTHNDIHNQYAIAFNRFMQSNTKASYNDFKILIQTMDYNDFAYMKLAEYMADIGFFDLSELAGKQIQDKTISAYLLDDIKLYYFPSKKLKTDDEIYLGEVFANIIYNDQSREATAELVKNTELLANSDYANFVVALGYLKSNEIIEAEKYINVTLKTNPKNLNYKKLKAEILSQGKNPKNASKIVSEIKQEKLYTTDITNKVNSLEQYVLYKSKKVYAEKMYHLGYYYYYENEPAKAVRALQSAVSSKKKLNKDIYALLSRVYFDSQDYEKAQDSAQKAVKLDGNNSTALLVLGDLSYRTGDYKTALKYYKNAETNTKNSSLPSIKVAQTYEKLEKSKKAFEIYEKVIRSYNDCYIAYYKVALKDKSKEVAYLKKSLSININFTDAWLELCRIAIEQKNFDEAKKYLKISKYIDENNYKYYYYQGLLAKRQGFDGKSYFEKSLMLEPDYKPAKEELNI